MFDLRDEIGAQIAQLVNRSMCGGVVRHSEEPIVPLSSNGSLFGEPFGVSMTTITQSSSKGSNVE